MIDNGAASLGTECVIIFSPLTDDFEQSISIDKNVYEISFNSISIQCDCETSILIYAQLPETVMTIGFRVIYYHIFILVGQSM